MKLKETIYNLRRQPVMTSVSIIGTALAIALVMIVVMMDQVKVAPIAPENNRDRWLVNSCFSITNTKWQGVGGSNGAMSYKTASEVADRMKIPECVTIYNGWGGQKALQVPGGMPVLADSRSVDANFWKVMNFTFVDGKPFDQADFEAGRSIAVITESVSRKLFGTIEATGREVMVDRAPYTVGGVVRDVTTLAKNAYAQIWMPITSTDDKIGSWGSGIMGSMSMIMLAKTKDDMPAIHDEFDRLMNAYFAPLKDDGWVYVSRTRPFDQETDAYTQSSNNDPDMASVYRQMYITFAILLLVPAINLSSMTHSRLRRQQNVIGIKRAYGATKTDIMMSLFTENMLITLVAGLLGLVITVIFAMFAADTLFRPSFDNSLGAASVDLDMLLKWSTFGMALLFCFILNVASAGLPAFQASRTNIVNALNKK